MTTTLPLKRLARPIAWSPQALIEIGLPAADVKTLIADGPRAVLERPRLSAAPGAKQRGAPTKHYVWGPDLGAHFGLPIPAQRRKRA